MLDKLKEFNVKIPAEVKKEMKRFAEDIVRYADKQEAEFLFPFLYENAEPEILGTITPNKLKHRGIKRMFNEDTYEVWYEQRGKVITPSFFRDPSVILSAFDDRYSKADK